MVGSTHTAHWVFQPLNVFDENRVCSHRPVDENLPNLLRDRAPSILVVLLFCWYIRVFLLTFFSQAPHPKQQGDESKREARYQQVSSCFRRRRHGARVLQVVGVEVKERAVTRAPDAQLRKASSSGARTHWIWSISVSKAVIPAPSNAHPETAQARMHVATGLPDGVAGTKRPQNEHTPRD